MSRAKKKANHSSSEILNSLTSKKFLKHLVFLALFVIGVLLLVFLWLRVYTNHGQKIELPDYIGQEISSASKDAKKKSFKILVSDSTFRVGVKGGQILDQNPKPGSMVKEKRKIYVTVTKFQADQKPLSTFPILYGRNFDRKQKELEVQGINCKIKDYKYDPGEPNHILEVWYNGVQVIGSEGRKPDVNIEVGGTLEFVLSRRYGGDVEIPDLKCKQLSEVRFLLPNYNLKLGDIREIGDIEDLESSWIRLQNPQFEPGKLIQMGEVIAISVVQERPEDCF